jgi:gamma-glutamyltranspeptidase/glutathione hydrolase
MKLRIADCRLKMAIGCVAAVATLNAQTTVPGERQRAETFKPDILGTHGIVAAGRHYSVSAGVRILQQGGNAIDAGAATVFAAAVCEISHFGFGGESPTMIYDAKTREVIVINGQGPAPAAATPALFAAEGRPPSNGPLGATLPAMVDAMALALETKGTMHLEQVMQPAIELADGFPMYEFLRHYLISERKATEQYEWSARTYYPDGRIPEVGEMFRQPNLAKTIRAIATGRQSRLRKNARPTEGDPRWPRCVLYGLDRATNRRGRPGCRRCFHLRRSGELSRQD